MAKRKQPIPTYPCGHCGTLIARIWALHHCGYCEKCEWMRSWEAAERCIIHPYTLIEWRKSRRVRAVRSPNVLYYRADIEHVRDEMIRTKRGWYGVLARSGQTVGTHIGTGGRNHG